jgi:uncharacterized protein YkwD
MPALQRRGERVFPYAPHLPIVIFVLLFAICLTPEGHAADEGKGIMVAALGARNNGGPAESSGVFQGIAGSKGQERALCSEERKLVELVNEIRTVHSLPPLRLSESLVNAAHGHSLDMAEHGFVSHSSSTGINPSMRMLYAGFRYHIAGENVAAGQRTPEAVVKSWMNSPGHRANLMNAKFSEMGVGYVYESGTPYRHYWTLDLGTKGY